MQRPLPEIGRLVEALTVEGKKLSADVIAQHIKMLLGRLIDDLEYEMFLHLNTTDAALYGQKAPFGEIVEAKYPDAAEDLEEAAKCLAVGQSTSCVFHLMRAMEVVVKRIGKKTGTVNVEKEWGKILSDIGKYVTSLPDGSPREKNRKNAWSAAHANLYHVKQAWRNETMHPKKTYTPEQAREVFAATKTFMNHLAGLV